MWAFSCFLLFPFASSSSTEFYGKQEPLWHRSRLGNPEFPFSLFGTSFSSSRVRSPAEVLWCPVSSPPLFLSRYFSAPSSQLQLSFSAWCWKIITDSSFTLSSACKFPNHWTSRKAFPLLSRPCSPTEFTTLIQFRSFCEFAGSSQPRFPKCCWVLPTSSSIASSSSSSPSFLHLLPCLCSSLLWTVAFRLWRQRFDSTAYELPRSDPTTHSLPPHILH